VTARRPAPQGDGREQLRLWLRLLRCTSLIEQQVRTRLRENFATTLPRFDVLAQLDMASAESPDGLTMSELSRRLMVSNGNVTGLTARLVRERLVSRRTSARDRRTQRVRLTAAGKRALDTMTPDHRAWILDLFAGLSAPEVRALHRLIGKLRDSVHAASRQEMRP
jgi:DNA-binding MarR family transcriptional regulator